MPIQSLLSRQQKRINLPSLVPQRGISSIDQPFQLINGRLVSIEDNQFNYLRSGFDINDIIYSIITLIMDKIKVAPWSVYEVKDEQALKAYHGMQQRKNWMPEDFSKARDLQHKALQVSKNPGKWGDLCKYPNEYETMSEFVGNGCGYKLLLGNKYIWGDILTGGANKGVPNELYCLPSQYINILCSDTFPTKIGGYFVTTWRQNFTPEEILHEKYFNPNWNINGQQLYGVAPLKAALKILARDNSSLASSASRFDNGGISGILYMKNQVGGPNAVDGETVLPEVQALKKTMVTEWTGERNSGKMGISGYELGWLPVGMTAEEMQQIENEKWNMRRLCNVWGVQSQMLNDPENKTFNSLGEAEKALTTRCALPALTSFRDNLNRKRANGWGGDGRTIIDFDMSCYTELNQNTQEMVSWITPLMDRGLPLNRALELLNLERIDNPYYDEPRVTTTMGETFDEHSVNVVDNALNSEL